MGGQDGARTDSPTPIIEANATTRGSLAEVSLLALKLGFIAFGGPAAHIAMLHDEVVTRRRWLSEQHFLDLLGATNLIPGPNSTEMVIHVGREQAGWRGLIAAGSLFILPAALIVGTIAWVYTRYGSTPTAEWILYGVKPVIIAIVLQALWGLLRTAVKDRILAVIAAVVFTWYLFGGNEIALLFGGGLAVLLIRNIRQLFVGWRDHQSMSAVLLLTTSTGLYTTVSAPATFSLTTLFLTFLKIGAVLYGSGYVLLAFLRNDFVERLGWLTDQQLLDAVAIGQFTPGPVFTTATFVGFLVGGWQGAVLATIGIFLPAFLFVALLNPVIPRLRQSRFMSTMLDGVNVAALGLMAAVTLQLAQDAIVDLPTLLLALAAAAILIRYKPNSAWLVLAGAAAGIIRSFLS